MSLSSTQLPSCFLAQTSKNGQLALFFATVPASPPQDRSHVGEPVTLLASVGLGSLVLAPAVHALMFRQRLVSHRGWISVHLSAWRGYHTIIWRRAVINGDLAGLVGVGGGTGLRGEVLGVLEGGDHGSLLVLLFETSLSVGIDALLGEDVGAGTRCRGGLC